MVVFGLHGSLGRSQGGFVVVVLLGCCVVSFPTFLASGSYKVTLKPKKCIHMPMFVPRATQQPRNYWLGLGL